MLPEIKIHTTENDTKYALFEQSEVISDEIRMRGDWNPAVLHICEKILEKKSGGRVLDIGAGIGTFSVPLALKFRDKFLFTAFEPIPVLHLQLCTNFFLNNIEDAQAFQYGISNKDEYFEAPALDFKRVSNHGTYSFLEDINRARGIVSSSKTDVYELKRLDHFKFANVALIKISTQGMEFEVLDGARNTIINNNFPPVVFECWTNEWYKDRRAKVLDFFASHAYEHYLDMGEHMVAFKTMSQYNHFMLPETDVKSISNFKVTEQHHETKSVLESQVGLAP